MEEEDIFKIGGKWNEILTLSKRPYLVKDKVVIADWMNLAKNDVRYHKWIKIVYNEKEFIVDSQFIFALARILKTTYKIREDSNERTP